MNDSWTDRMFARERPLIGVVHLPPLPGAPRASAPLEDIWTVVAGEAKAMLEAGIDALILENHGDAPFVKERSEPHVPAVLAVFADRLKQAHRCPIGINLLRNDACGALGAAVAGGADFIRVNVLTGVTATDQGLIEGCADRLQRYRRSLGATVSVLADVDVKFGTPLYTPRSEILAHATLERALADALIVTGEATGSGVALDELARVKRAVGSASVLAGSGVTADNVGDVLAICDGVIVGSDLKVDGWVENPVDPARLERFVAAARGA